MFSFLVDAFFNVIGVIEMILFGLPLLIVAFINGGI